MHTCIKCGITAEGIADFARPAGWSCISMAASIAGESGRTVSWAPSRKMVDVCDLCSGLLMSFLEEGKVDAFNEVTQ